MNLRTAKDEVLASDFLDPQIKKAFNPVVRGLMVLDKYPNATLDEEYSGPEFIVSGGVDSKGVTQPLIVSDEDRHALQMLGWENDDDSVVWMYVAESLTTINGQN